MKRLFESDVVPVAEFEKVGAQVVGVSIDSPYTHLAWKNTPRNKGGLGKLDFPLLADLGKQAAGDYEVLLADGIAARGVFVIDEKGILQSYTVNNLGVGRNVSEIIRLINGFKFVAAHGEVTGVAHEPTGDNSRALESRYFTPLHHRSRCTGTQRG